MSQPICRQWSAKPYVSGSVPQPPAAHASWGEGRRPNEFWTQPGPGVTHWRQVGWDAGVDRYEDAGFYDAQVTRDFID